MAMSWPGGRPRRPAIILFNWCDTSLAPVPCSALGFRIVGISVSACPLHAGIRAAFPGKTQTGTSSLVRPCGVRVAVDVQPVPKYFSGHDWKTFPLWIHRKTPNEIPSWMARNPSILASRLWAVCQKIFSRLGREKSVESPRPRHCGSKL